MKIYVTIPDDDVANFTFAGRAVRYLMERPDRRDAWLQYGEPPQCEAFVRRVKSGFSVSIHSVEK